MLTAVSGGTGFIGKSLVARLARRGDRVRVLTRGAKRVAANSCVELYECDLLQARPDELAAMLDGVEVFYHCAGQLKDESAMRALHVDATRKLVEAASGRIGRWVQLSSVGVYGPARQGVVTEETALNPIGEYEITKAESDCIVMDAAQRGAFEYSVLRPSNVFGAEMTNQSLFGMISMLDRGLFFYIGTPGASANYIHVQNVAEGLVRCGTLPEAHGRVYNLSDHRTMEQFVSVIANEMGTEAPRLRLPEMPVRLLARIAGSLPGFPLSEARVDALTIRARYATARIERELGYRHPVTMEQGLAELVAAWKNKRAGVRDGR